MMLGAAQSAAPGIARPPPRRKRKADAQDGDRERLSKRLSLLNIEQNGSKLYVPVETPRKRGLGLARDDAMQLDDSSHKVYIYNIDDELSSDSDGEQEGKLVFLPDIEKHLRENRIPPQVLANGDGELAGMQLVLYSDPKSLSVPEEQDGVRKAIIEARQRARERQRRETEDSKSMANRAAQGYDACDACDAMEVD